MLLLAPGIIKLPANEGFLAMVSRVSCKMALDDVVTGQALSLQRFPHKFNY